MKREFIPYKEALALKELGFDEPCVAWWFDGSLLMLSQSDNSFPNPKIEAENNNIEIKKEDFNSDDDYQYYLNSCSAPLYQQAFRWFREKHDLSGEVIYYLNGEYEASTYSTDLDVADYEMFFKGEFRECQNACLKKLIEIVKNKKYEK